MWTRCSGSSSSRISGRSAAGHATAASTPLRAGGGWPCGPTSAGGRSVANEREGGTGHELVRLPADAPHELSRQSYIVWADNGGGLPETLAPGEVDLLPGYYWSGRS